ncbi:MAG: cyclic-di-AMP receptor [Thermaceae bacterium]
MRLILAIVQDADAPGLTKALLEKGFRSTKLASTGGFLREGNTTLLLGVEGEQLVVFVLPVESFFKI